MSKLRDVVVLILVGSALVLSLLMIRRAVGVASPWFSLVLMFSILGTVAFCRPLFLLKPPEFLRTTFEWEKEGRLYGALGVPAFGAVLRRTPLRYLNAFVYLARQADPGVVRAEVESAEMAHLLAACSLIPHILYSGVQGWWGSVAWLVFVQLVVNVYPILHLRWVVARLDRLQRRRLSRCVGAA